MIKAYNTTQEAKVGEQQVYPASWAAAQLVKCLLYMHEDPSLIPITHIKNQCGVAYLNLNRGQGDT